MRWLRQLTPVTYLSKLLGIRCLAAFLQLEIHRVTTHNITEYTTMANYFNTLNLRQQLAQLGKCRFMSRDEFADGASYLQGKKVVIVGCGAQGSEPGPEHARLWSGYFLRPA